MRSAVPDVSPEHRDLTFGGDMRDVAVSCKKIAERLGSRTTMSVRNGIVEVRDAVANGLIFEPTWPRYPNHAFQVQ